MVNSIMVVQCYQDITTITPTITKFHDLQKDLDAFREHFRYDFCDLDGPSTAIIVQHALLTRLLEACNKIKSLQMKFLTSFKMFAT
jgi:hypothetical protein